MSSPLIPSSNMPWFENPEERRRIDEDNQRFKQLNESATPEQTEEMKNEASEIFWKSFDPNENIIDVSELEKQDEFENPEDILNSLDSVDSDNQNLDTEESLVSEASNDDTEELTISNNPNNESNSIEQASISSSESISPYSPVVDRLLSINQITQEEHQEILSKLNSYTREEWKNYFLAMVENIDNQDIKNNIVDSFESNNDINESNFDKSDFYKDSTDLNIDLDNWVWGLEIMLAKNYIDIPNPEWESNKDENISQSMDVTLNTILTNNSKDFIQNNSDLIAEIKSQTNLNDKYNSLKKLYKEDLKEDAKIGWKKWLEESKRKKNSLIEKAKKLNEEINEAKNIEDTQLKEKKLEELNKQKQEIIDEWNWIDNFEAEILSLSGWDIDKTSESTKNNETN